MMNAASIRIAIPSDLDPMLVVGPSDSVLRALESRCSAAIVARGDEVRIKGPSLEVDRLADVFTEIFEAARRGCPLSADEARHVYEDRMILSSHGGGSELMTTAHGRPVRPKTAGQQRYVDAIERSTITFGLGPAGTGKTYLAMALAVAALRRHDVSRIILTRPVVEAGESLGFLPGTLEDKVDPYVRPLFDALFDLVDSDRASTLLEKGLVEIAPLAYMRGRTLNDAFVILDEAQNTTPEQMKMFLTRLGFNSKFVITGDASQRDLVGRDGGLAAIEGILEGVDGISFIHLGRKDVVRHSLVGAIVDAYEFYEAERDQARRSTKGEPHGRAHQQ